MKTPSPSVQAYLAKLPADRRLIVEAVRAAIVENLDPLYEEGPLYGMIGYFVPHKIYPPGYHCKPSDPLPIAVLGSQKSHVALHFMPMYGDEAFAEWFRRAWAKSGRKLDMGKACIRLKKLEDAALEVIGEAVRRVPARDYIAHCEAAIAGRAKTKASAKPAGKAKPSTPAKSAGPAKGKKTRPAPKSRRPKR